MQNNRIEVLDSFRGIAILMVIFFHYFSRWTTLYPYQGRYDFFTHGKFGVHFFFMISGFVILFTLEKTKSLTQFWFNRFVRLLPAMFFASIITYLFFTLFDTEFLFPTSHYLKNVLVSLTFIQPDLLSSLTRYTIQLDYISASYWSLWVEIQFYVLASFFYFFFQKKFYFYFYVMAVLLMISSFLLSQIDSHNHIVLKIKSLKSIFTLFDAMPFFCLGAIFYTFHENNQKRIKNSLWQQCVFLFFTTFLILTNYHDFKKLFLIAIFTSLFLMMIYAPVRISFLNNKVLNSIGVSSYFLYLIHENIGVFFIHNNYIELDFLPFLVPIFYMLILILWSIVFTKKIEEKIIVFLKRTYKF